jgi:hypothetical protein
LVKGVAQDGLLIVPEVPLSEVIGEVMLTLAIGFKDDDGIATMKKEKSEQVM